MKRKQNNFTYFKEELFMKEATIIDITKEIKKGERAIKRRELKEKIQKKVKETGEFLWENKEIVVLVTTALIRVGSGVSKNARLKKEQNLKDLYCYDRSMGHYWKLKRQLTSDEWLRIEKQKREGKKLGVILEEMRVLK